MATPWPDLLRLLTVPVFGWAAWRDLRTRRVPRAVWWPLYAVGVALLGWEVLTALAGPSSAGRVLALRAGIGIGLAGVLAYGFWWFGWFGRADRKAILALALVFPLAPTYQLGGLTLPLVRTPLGAFPLTVLTDGVLAGAAYPVAVAGRNALRGRFAPVMLVGLPVDWRELPSTHGKLLEDVEGYTTDGLDLDALRMYLRWRGVTLAALRRDPDRYRDPASLPPTPNPPTDGAVDRSENLLGEDPARPDGGSIADPWGAAAFLEDIEGSAYGTTPGTLRDALELLAVRDRETVWVSPGLPFLVPLFVGLCLAVTYGDVLFAVLRAIGVAPG